MYEYTLYTVLTNTNMKHIYFITLRTHKLTLNTHFTHHQHTHTHIYQTPNENKQNYIMNYTYIHCTNGFEWYREENVILYNAASPFYHFENHYHR